MKLFQRLLIAPAALGLLAPLAANADVVEYKGEELSAGAFASATKMTGSSVFTTGFEDTAGTADNKFTVEYNYKIDLNTSFTGSDNLYAGIQAGNQNDLNMDSQVAQGGNGLEVENLYYQFPLGDFAVTAGPLMDQDGFISATLSQYSDAFRLSALPWGLAGDTGAGVAVQYVSDSGWNASANILSEEGNADNALNGFFTEEGADQYTIALGYDAASGNYGGGVVYTAEDQGTATDTKDTSIGGGVWFRPDGFPTISLTLDKLDDEDGTDATDFLVGADYPLGDGTLSAAWQASDRNGTNLTNYEVYYNYPVNDGVTVQGGLFSEEQDGVDNTQGIVVETFFKF